MAPLFDLSAAAAASAHGSPTPSSSSLSAATTARTDVEMGEADADMGGAAVGAAASGATSLHADAVRDLLVWDVTSIGAEVTVSTPALVAPARVFKADRSTVPDEVLQHARATGSYAAITTVEYARGDVVPNVVVLAASISCAGDRPAEVTHITVRDSKVYVLVLDESVARLKAYQLVASHSIVGTLKYALRKRGISSEEHAELVSAALAARWAELGGAVAAPPAPQPLQRAQESLGMIIRDHDGLMLRPAAADVVDDDEDVLL